MLRSARVQILLYAVICGILCGFSAYWLRGELVKEGLYTLEPKQLPALNQELARTVAASLREEAFAQSVCTPHFKPDDLKVQSTADGKWIEVKLTFHCWGRARFSLLKFSRIFEPDDEAAKQRNADLIASFEKSLKQVESRAFGG